MIFALASSHVGNVVEDFCGELKSILDSVLKNDILPSLETMYILTE